MYDTYGFPVEITAEIAGERGVTVDMMGFSIEMENQRKQSQAAHNVVKLSVGNETEIVKSIPDVKGIRVISYSLGFGVYLMYSLYMPFGPLSILTDSSLSSSLLQS